MIWNTKANYLTAAKRDYWTPEYIENQTDDIYMTTIKINHFNLHQDSPGSHFSIYLYRYIDLIRNENQESCDDKILYKLICTRTPSAHISPSTYIDI